MIELILGNLSSLLASICDAVSASRKTHKSILTVQTASQVLYCFSGTILKGYSAAVQNAIGVVRNIAAIKNINSKALEWGLVVAGVVLGLLCNNRGLWGLLPVIANLEYSLAVFRFKNNEIALKTAFLFSVLLFTVFNAVIWNVVGAVSNFILLIVTAVFLINAIRCH